MAMLRLSPLVLAFVWVPAGAAGAKARARSASPWDSSDSDQSGTTGDFMDQYLQDAGSKTSAAPADNTPTVSASERPAADATPSWMRAMNAMPAEQPSAPAGSTDTISSSERATADVTPAWERAMDEMPAQHSSAPAEQPAQPQAFAAQPQASDDYPAPVAAAAVGSVTGRSGETMKGQVMSVTLSSELQVAKQVERDLLVKMKGASSFLQAAPAY